MTSTALPLLYFTILSSSIVRLIGILLLTRKGTDLIVPAL